MLGVEWSRKLAKVFAEKKPDSQTRSRLLEIFESADDESQLPQFFLDFVNESESTKNVEITKAPRAAVNNALAMLANLPTATIRDGKELIASPWPIVTRPTLDPDVWIDSTVEDVSIEDLYATQQFLNRERVAQFVENPGAIENGRRALANVYDNGRMLIVDGHHRLAAYWLLGANRANVWYLVES